MLRMKQLILILFVLLIASTVQGEVKNKYKLIFGGSDAVDSLLDRGNRLFCKTLEKESKKQASRLKREMRKIFTNLDGVRRMRMPKPMRRDRGIDACLLRSSTDDPKHLRAR